MDEPTSALSGAEIEHLYAIIRGLRDNGVGIVYISHKLGEVFEIADRVSVLRDGQLVRTMPIPATNPDEIIRLMVGRDIKDLYPPKASRLGDVIFKVEGLTLPGKVDDVSFELREGEILGFAGLVGSGRTETARAVFGAERPAKGRITLRNREVVIRGPGDAIRQGICYLSEDRKEFGLFLTMSVRRNIASSSLPAYSSPLQFLDFNRVREAARGFLETLDIRPRNDSLNIINLSGGNQQKTMLAKWLAAKPTILIADEPTRGVDIGAKVKIHQHLRWLAENGVGVIVISSELPEVLGLSDRVLVFRNGSVSADMRNDNLTQSEVMHYAAN
jgi:ABC-type sugar transport system ATPase subunit